MIAPVRVQNQSQRIERNAEPEQILVLKLNSENNGIETKVQFSEKTKKKPRRKVNWTEDVVDNEDLERKKSNSKFKILSC